jgi:hypothetical protein
MAALARRVRRVVVFILVVGEAKSFGKRGTW